MRSKSSRTSSSVRRLTECKIGRPLGTSWHAGGALPVADLVPMADGQIPWRVYEILANVALRHIETELNAGRGDRQQLEADREMLERMLLKPPARTAA